MSQVARAVIGSRWITALVLLSAVMAAPRGVQANPNPCLSMPDGTSCPDTDGNECTIAQCDGTGNCDQTHAFVLDSTPCVDTDHTTCTIAGCNGAGVCDQNHVSVCTPTATPTDTPTATPTNTPTVTPTPTNTPTPSKVTMILGGVTAGSTTLTGQSDPTCPCTSPPCDGKVHVFDCGPETPPVCHDSGANADVEIAVPVTKHADGTFTILLTTPLKPGQILYATDGCFDPLLIGPATVVPAPSVVPQLSPRALIALVGVLSAVGLLGVWRRGGRRGGSRG